MLPLSEERLHHLQDLIDAPFLSFLNFYYVWHISYLVFEKNMILATNDQNEMIIR